MNLRSKCAQQICRRCIAQNLSADARSLTKVPASPSSSFNVLLSPVATILNTVAAVVAMVHSATSTPH